MRAIADAPGIFQHAHSLENVANVVTGERADQGVAFNPKGCEVIFSHDSGCWVGNEKAIQDCRLAQFDAFILELTLGWALGDMPADPKARAIEAMAVGTSAVLERCMAVAPSYVAAGTNMSVPALSGTIPVTGIKGKAATSPARATPQPYLSAATAVTGGTTVADRVGLLEAKLVDASDHIGSGGTILISPADFPGMRDMVQYENGQFRTRATGSRVVIGNYPPGDIFAVVGEVDLYLGPIELVETNERVRNEYIVQVERYGVAVWNTCAAFASLT